jgi:hypothetical protein
MKNPFDLKAPMTTALSANVYADGVRLAFGENAADTGEATYHTAVFVPAQLYMELRKLIVAMEPKLAVMKEMTGATNAVQN